MVTRIKDLVRNEGKITTIEELDKKGLIEYKEVKNFFGGKKVRTAYFADIKGTREGWEIGKVAFLSRMESESKRIWEEECGGRCAILHLERCPRYDGGTCVFPETRKAKEIVGQTIREVKE